MLSQNKLQIPFCSFFNLQSLSINARNKKATPPTAGMKWPPMIRSTEFIDFQVNLILRLLSSAITGMPFCIFKVEISPNSSPLQCRMNASHAGWIASAWRLAFAPLVGGPLTGFEFMASPVALGLLFHGQSTVWISSLSKSLIRLGFPLPPVDCARLQMGISPLPFSPSPVRVLPEKFTSFTDSST